MILQNLTLNFQIFHTNRSTLIKMSLVYFIFLRKGNRHLRSQYHIMFNEYLHLKYPQLLLKALILFMKASGS
jgi:hypothetical protein